jgi:hypothetical protein
MEDGLNHLKQDNRGPASLCKGGLFGVVRLRGAGARLMSRRPGISVFHDVVLIEINVSPRNHAEHVISPIKDQSRRRTRMTTGELRCANVARSHDNAGICPSTEHSHAPPRTSASTH